MAEKGVSEESLSRRLSRKRNSFLEERECKKRRGSNTGEDKERSIDVRPGLQAGPSSDLVGGTSPSDSDGNDERDIVSGID